MGREFGRLDVLVNNAGILSQEPDVLANLRATLETNLFGAATTTEAFLPLLLSKPDSTGGGGKSGIQPQRRLVFVGSSMGSLAGSGDPQSRYYKAVTGDSPLAYRVSKAALNMLMLEYWKRHGGHERGATLRVFTADSGANLTNFGGGKSGRARERARQRGVPGPESGARVIAGVVRGERDGQEGRMLGVYGVSPW